MSWRKGILMLSCHLVDLVAVFTLFQPMFHMLSARKQFSSEERRLSKEARSSQETVKVGSFSQELSSEERIASKRRQKAYISAEKLRMKESRQLARRRMMHSGESSSSAESRLRPGAFRVITLKKTDLPRTLTTTTTASLTNQFTSTTLQPASSKQMRVSC